MNPFDSAREWWEYRKCGDAHWGPFEKEKDFNTFMLIHLKMLLDTSVGKGRRADILMDLFRWRDTEEGHNKWDCWSEYLNDGIEPPEGFRKAVLRLLSLVRPTENLVLEEVL